MTVIAMTREMGTRGKDVAALVAQRLGIEVIHHELVERHLAERLMASESTVHRFLEGEATMWERWQVDDKRLFRFTAEEILELAGRGNVLIRGWGAAQLLRDVPHVICVRICAPMRNRVKEMMNRLGIEDAKIAMREIQRSDDAHARAVQRQFNSDWRDPTGYDITINMDHVGVNEAASLLQQLAKCGSFEASAASHVLMLDKLIEARVRSLLDENLPDSPIGSSLRVSSNNGQVTIDGVIGRESRLGSLRERIEQMDGVRSVTDDTVAVLTRYGP